MEYEILQTYKLGKAVRAVRDAAAKEGSYYHFASIGFKPVCDLPEDHD